jgi:CRISPR system Cascade subunit CasD
MTAGMTMSTLLMRLAGPLQAWGADSKFSKRMTGREPTKSGVIGLVAAALGLRRTDAKPLAELPDDKRFAKLCKLCFGVRTDQPGQLVRDFHTARTYDGKQAFISERYYLADAIFLAGLEGEDALLEEIAAALQNPYFPLFLGRRACPPTGQMVLGNIKKNISLEDALQKEEWQASPWYMRKRKREAEITLEIVRDARPEDDGAFTMRDLPLSFEQVHRRYTFRSVVSNPREAVKVANPYAEPCPETETEHDAMAEVP